jgi:hypothetical protein
MNPISDRALKYLALIQAISLTAYLGLLSILIFNLKTAHLLQKVSPTFALFFFLMILFTSILICTVLTFYFPFVIFWYKKQTREAVRLIFYLIRWMVLFIFAILVFIILMK